MSIKVGILGATGYGAAELLRLLEGHPEVEVCSLVARSRVGENVNQVHTNLRGYPDLRISEQLDFTALKQGTKAIIFSALPHGVSLEALHGLAQVPELCLIDLSGDLRLQSSEVHQRYYPEVSFEPELRSQFVYGLTDLNREAISQATRVANPGCFATACALAALPLTSAGYQGKIVFDAKTGSSGSGRGLKEGTHHPRRNANFLAYKPFAHQHEPEIMQTLGDPESKQLDAVFLTQSMPVVRGIYVSAYFFANAEVDSQQLYQQYREFYQRSPFIRICETPPQLVDVVGTNYCDIGVFSRGKQILVISAIDNLVKGMAGQAIQNMNLICGLEESCGLTQSSLGVF